MLGLAARRVLGRSLGPYDFKGGEKSQCFRILRGLGFTIQRKDVAISPGDDWTEEEIRILVEDYFSMLRMDRAGLRYSKAEHNRALQQQLPGRSKGSIEYKYQNVSGVLYDEGFPCIPGYKPARNYQRQVLPEVVLEQLGAGEGDVAAIEQAIDTVPTLRSLEIDFSNCEVTAPDRMEGAGASETRFARRRARRFDYASKDALNRKLGRAGEEFILSRERWYLILAGRADLASRIEHVSETQGDGLGYDITSFDAATGDPVYIEVKTTNCDRDFPFYLSQGELDASIELGGSYRLYRVFNFSTSPQFYRVEGDLSQGLCLRAGTYEARRA